MSTPNPFSLPDQIAISTNELEIFNAKQEFMLLHTRGIPSKQREKEVELQKQRLLAEPQALQIINEIYKAIKTKFSEKISNLYEICAISPVAYFDRVPKELITPLLNPAINLLAAKKETHQPNQFLTDWKDKFTFTLNINHRFNTYAQETLIAIAVTKPELRTAYELWQQIQNELNNNNLLPLIEKAKNSSPLGVPDQEADRLAALWNNFRNAVARFNLGLEFHQALNIVMYRHRFQIAMNRGKAILIVQHAKDIFSRIGRNISIVNNAIKRSGLTLSSNILNICPEPHIYRTAIPRELIIDEQNPEVHHIIHHIIGLVKSSLHENNYSCNVLPGYIDVSNFYNLNPESLTHTSSSRSSIISATSDIINISGRPTTIYYDHFGLPATPTASLPGSTISDLDSQVSIESSYRTLPSRYSRQ